MTVVVDKPDNSFYCRFDADEKFIVITLENGYRVILDRKVEPHLKKFLESLWGAPENKKWKKRVWPGGAFLANALPHGPTIPWIIVKK